MIDFPARFAYTSAADRRDRLGSFVIEQGYCTITELSSRFGVSEMTIRRDVVKLAADGRLRAFHGGVGSVSPVDISGIDYSDRDLEMAEAKRAIAASALKRVPRGAVVGIDAGTTANQLASLLPPDEHLKVITPSLPAVNTLLRNPGIDLVTCLGGDLHLESLSFAGSATLSAIANLHIDILFLAASGLNERGAFCGNSFDAITKRALIDVADTVILIADSSKFLTSAMVRICGWGAIDLFIVDDGITPADEALLKQSGVHVEQVPTSPPARLAPDAAR
jgi:DeoR/GlpR family transcriptional regulator of sugar metabolism